MAILCVGLPAAFLDLPFAAPPVGVTALLAASRPHAPESHPLRALGGHLLGLSAGAFAVWATSAGVWEPSSALDLRHAAACGLAVGLTAWSTAATRLEHPPACATTLLVALGIIRAPLQGLSLVLGAGLVAVLARPRSSREAPTG